jgi:hypothetical protein
LESRRLTAGSLPVAARRRGWDAFTMCLDPGADRLWIEIDPAAEPISGVVHRGSEPARPFDGWLELVALLEAERDGRRPIGPPDRR